MKSPLNRSPNPLPDDGWEAMVRQTAAALPYPPTPHVADRVVAHLTNEHDRQTTSRLQPLWVASVILALLLGLLAVPPVRAAILEFLQVGAVRIWLVEPAPTPTAPQEMPIERSQPTPTPIRSLLNLAGETTLTEAEAKTGFAIALPTYPPDLGTPDRVFYQELSGPAVILVWTKPEQPEQALLSLQIFGSDTIVNKGSPPVVMTATVNGRDMVWLNGPYILAYGGGSQPQWEMRYLVSGRVLLWQEDGLTYRLEGDFTFEEAIRIAESLE
jgi:hypothetical protein